MVKHMDRGWGIKKSKFNLDLKKLYWIKRNTNHHYREREWNSSNDYVKKITSYDGVTHKTFLPASRNLYKNLWNICMCGQECRSPAKFTKRLYCVNKKYYLENVRNKQLTGPLNRNSNAISLIHKPKKLQRITKGCQTPLQTWFILQRHLLNTQRM